MGREIKRLQAGFQWPVGKAWEGYLSPHWRKCPQEGITCFNGENAAAVYLSHLTNMFCVVADSAARGQTHPYLYQLPYLSSHPDWSKQSEEVRRKFLDLCLKLMGDDHYDGFLGLTGKGFRLYFRLLELVGVSTNSDGTDDEKGYTWGNCAVCKGTGIHPDDNAAADAWEPTEPPAGDWWQVWETVSEGSPVTPSFATAEELIDYLVQYGDAWDQQRGDGGWKRENAEAFVKRGNAVSLVVAGGKVYTPRDGMP